MHTATRLASELIPKVRAANPAARICCFGLYAPLNEDYLRSLGVQTILGGEFEAQLAQLAEDDQAPAGSVSLERLRFLPPDRSTLPPLQLYPKLSYGGGRHVAGYTEASRGCKHHCRHCPIVPVYNGVFRVVQPEVVLEDIRRQVAMGAEHITFGDPDFFNGPAHARRIVEALHAEHPNLTYDATVKIEHLLKHRELLPILRDTGCLFLVSAVESVDNAVLSKLDKGHTRADFLEAAALLRAHDLTLTPTFIPFTPWTTAHSYRELLRVIGDLDLIENVAPVQLTLRLLVPAGSRLLELEDIRRVLEGFDREALVHRWTHPDPEVDRLARAALQVVHGATSSGASRWETFRSLWQLVNETPLPEGEELVARATIPYLEEPWFC